MPEKGNSMSEVPVDRLGYYCQLSPCTVSVGLQGTWDFGVNAIRLNRIAEDFVACLAVHVVG